MKVIFSKRQLEVLKEEENGGDLTVLVKNPQDTNSMKKAISNPGLVKNVVIPSEKPLGNNPANIQTGKLNAKIEADVDSTTSQSDINKFLNDPTVKNSSLSKELELSHRIRYSKKELNEILFR